VLFIAAGKNAGIRPADLVGAIAGEAGLSSRQIGGIQINPKHSLVEVPAALADRVIKALKSTSIRGQKVNVRRSKD
jgi:ATP-dependent RNA helicase DeaD